MYIVNSYNNIPIRISNERLNHIYKNHPEMVNELDKIEETLKNPEIVTEGDNGELLEKKKNIQWNYDAGADVLYRFHFKLRK